MIIIQASKTHSLGMQVILKFQLTQHSLRARPLKVLHEGRDEKLMKNLENYFALGNICKKGNALDFRVTKMADITEKIIPFFQNYSILGVKALDFADWCKVAELMQEREKTFDKKGL